MRMKIAFCFLTRANLHQPAVWDRFFGAGDRAHYSIYCHAKWPAAVSDGLLAANQIRAQVATKHGHISIVVASAKLLEVAYEEDEQNTFFVLVSESTVPIEPLARIVAGLAAIENRSIISFSVPPVGSEWHLRLGAVADPSIFAARWFRHDQWIILHRQHVGALLKKPCYTMFENVFAADEHYFMNVLFHVLGVPMSEIINRPTTWVNWREPEVVHVGDPRTGLVVRTIHPKTYNSLAAAELVEAQARGCWFFRKVSATCDCNDILHRIACE